MKPSPAQDHIDEIVTEATTFAAKWKRGDWDETNAIEIWTRANAAIQRIAPAGSAYRRQAQEINAQSYEVWQMLPDLLGVLQALSKDVKAGYLRPFEELIHGELFGDFLDMAQHLVESGYKDAAAVIAGGSLEGHLRQLAKKSSVDMVRTTASGAVPKTANLLNSDLDKAGAYSVTDQKNVTAWLDLRNNAAHGKYLEYEKGQVSIMIDGIRNFITRVPA